MRNCEPLPLWEPKNPEKSQMWQFMQFVSQRFLHDFKHYQALYDWSIADPKLFWSSLCAFFKLKWDEAPEQILRDYQHPYDAKWFVGARFNFAQKLLSRQDAHIALICHDENGQRSSLSYAQLYQEVAQCAAGLRSIGVQAGDRIGALMPNRAETIIALLATASLGAIWSSCSPDFGVETVLDRLGQIEPRVLFITDGHRYQGKQHSALDKIKRLHKAMPSLKHLIIVPNIQEPPIRRLSKTVYWDDFIKPVSEVEFASLPFNHPLYILFSSGTTGKPKCIVHGAGGTLLQHLKELGLHCNLGPSSNLCFYTTCGWMMWNWMVSALALGATLTLYEGAPTYPKNNSLFKCLEEEKVTVFGTSAKFLSTIEKTGFKPNREFDLKHLQTILSTGSPLLPTNYDFVYQHVKKEVQLSSISGGTDIISCFALGNPILPVYRGEIQCLGLGLQVEVWDEQGQSIVQKRGELVCTQPFPSMPLGFWNDPKRVLYKKAYFERFPDIWTHGDFAEITAHKGLIIYGRSDAILNPGGVRIGTAEIYRQVEKVDAVVDSIVIGQQWQNDERVILFVVLRENRKLSEELCNTIRQVIRQNASPRHIPAKIIQVAEIPRTLSGKLVEIAVRQAVHGEPIKNLQSLANPESLEYFKNREELND